MEVKIDEPRRSVDLAQADVQPARRKGQQKAPA